MQYLAEKLINTQQRWSQQKASIGFDGFIDSIVRLIKTQSGCDGKTVYFDKMADWGEYILNKQTGNFSIEIQPRSIKAGGNMPNMSAALANLGVTVNCVGAMGYPAIDPLFSRLPVNCKLYSFAPPGVCQAIEFEDGKIMQAEMQGLQQVDWSILKDRLSIAKLVEIFDSASLIGMLNWGELTAGTGFWKGLLQDILPLCHNEKQKTFFVDLSDCSSRSKADILEVLALLNNFTRYGKVILSANQNEAMLIHQCLFDERAGRQYDKMLGEQLFDALKVDTLLLHNRHMAMAFSKDGYAERKSFFVANPKLLTGAGDNFNAGFCFGLLADCTLEENLVLGHLLSAAYIKNAESPTLATLLEALKNII